MHLETILMPVITITLENKLYGRSRPQSIQFHLLTSTRLLQRGF